MTLTGVSLFAGVGGFDLAMQRNGVDVRAAIEIDTNARGVLAHQFPGIALFGDVQDVSGNDLIAAGFDPDNGVLTAGWPCQDLSIAGKRAGYDGARSALFWEVVRLLDELKPRWFVGENVPGLLSSRGGRDMAVTVKALADLGYGVVWRVLDAQYFGLAQRRRRVVFVGCLGDLRRPVEVLLEPESSAGDFAQSNTQRKTVTGGAGAGASTDSGVTNSLSLSLSLYRQQSFFQYQLDSKVSPMKARDHKYATDLIVSTPGHQSRELLALSRVERTPAVSTVKTPTPDSW